MTDYATSGKEASESVDEQRAWWEDANYGMTVCANGIVNVENRNYGDAAVASILITPGTMAAAGSTLLVFVGVALAAMVASAALPGEPVHIPLLR